MGVKGLWTELKAYQREASLTDISIREGFVQNVANVRGFRVGIDASIWIRRGTAHLDQARNAVLATLFIHTMRLFSMTAVIPYFVFDGPGRPDIKRQTHVRGTDHWITKSFKALLTIMGIAWAVAPGEAEAELAWLCADGWIDAVMTEDVDVAIFGATRIFRM
ncbi:PIN domain-like protein [Hymenopellis radicata]|nr:PIN domain-like protein [Hymenopellis radicata]